MTTNKNDELVLTVCEVSNLLKLSMGDTYAGVRSGIIPSIRVGRRILIPKMALNALLKGNGSGNYNNTLL